MKVLTVPSSGSLQGTTASHNRAGQYVRSRRAPVQPVGTGRRSFIRSSFAAASSGWSALTSVEQNAFTAYALEYPITDALGQTITLTGQQIYVALGVQALNVAAALPTAPPISNAVPAITPASLAVVHTTPTVTPTWTAPGTGNYVLVGLAAPTSSGVNNPPNFWQAGVAAGTLTTLACGTLQANQFGTVQTGKKFWCKLTPVNQYFVTGTPVIIQAIST
jgi:hypothetical protein